MLILVIARLALFALFITSGLAKLFDRAGSRQAIEGFGVPGGLAGVVATALPPVEIAIAAALVVGKTTRVGAAAAVLLLALFAAGIGAALARGKRVACHCFGALSVRTAGPRALARNLALAAVATFVVVATGEHPLGIGTWAGELSAAQSVAFWLSLVIVVLSAAAIWAGRELLRQQGRLMLRLDALEGVPEKGSALPLRAPSFTLKRPAGGDLSLDGLLAGGGRVLLVFSDPHCGPCAAAVPVVAAAQRAMTGRLTIAVLTAGSTPQSEAAWREHQLDLIGIDEDSAVAHSYGVVGSPAAVLIASDGKIATAPVYGVQRISDLLHFASPLEASARPDDSPQTRLVAVGAEDGDRVGD